MEDEDLEYTELLYGKKSDQYALKKKMLEAISKLSDAGILHMGKEFTQEYIVYSFRTDIFDKNKVHAVVKRYWNKEKTDCKRRKEQIICKSVSAVANKEIYLSLIHI